MKFEYKTIDTSTEAGLKKAERLQKQGWKILNNGFWSIQFEREKKVKKK